MYQLFNNTNTNSSEIPMLGKLNTPILVLGFIILEIGKQISNYSINYYNGGSYPLPQTVMVRQIPPFHSSPSLPRWSWWSSSG